MYSTASASLFLVELPDSGLRNAEFTFALRSYFDRIACSSFCLSALFSVGSTLVLNYQALTATTSVRNFSRQRLTIASSIEFSLTSRMMCTMPLWSVRLTACKSALGFQSESNRTTVSAVCRFRLTLSAQVVSRNTEVSQPFALNWPTTSSRASLSVSLSSLLYFNPIISSRFT